MNADADRSTPVGAERGGGDDGARRTLVKAEWCHGWWWRARADDGGPGDDDRTQVGILMMMIRWTRWVSRLLLVTMTSQVMYHLNSNSSPS